MWSQQIFVALLLATLTLQHVTAVVNNGQTKTIEEPIKATSDNKETEKSSVENSDLQAESSETANRREAPAVLDTYGPPSLGLNGNLPIPVYGVPNSLSNNIVYPAPPADIPPPPPKLLPGPLYGPPNVGKIYGVPQIKPLPPISKGYGPPLPIKYGTPSFALNQFSVNLSPPKPVYGPPKSVYGPPSKPLHSGYKYPSKNFGFRPPKPIYGVPVSFKDNFNFNKGNNFNNLNLGNSYSTNTFSSNAFSNLYSGLSSLNHQYGAPILPSKQIVSTQYGAPTLSAGLSTQYGVPANTVLSGSPLVAYGPPQPSANPKPPHPGAPAPPTPPDIKYDGWQPIPGLVSKRPVEEVHQISGHGGGQYNDLSPPPLIGGHNQVSGSYGAPPVTLDISHGNSILDQPGLSDSYGAPLNAVTGSNSVSDSYNAPLGSVTGSGGVVASSGSEAHGAGYHGHSNSQSSNSHSISLDLSSIGVGHGSDIQAVKSIEYDITPSGGAGYSGGASVQISSSYGAPQSSIGNTYASGHSYNSFGSSFGGSSSSSYKGHKGGSLLGSTFGLVPPSEVYGVPPSSQYGIPLSTNSHASYKGSTRGGSYTSGGGKASFSSQSFGGALGSSSSYLPPSPPIKPSSSYGVPSGSDAISFQNIAHGSSTAGIDLQHSALNIEGANALPLTSYNVPLGGIDGSYTVSSTNEDNSVSLDYSHPPVSIDLTDGKQVSLSPECYNKQQQLNVPSLAYGVPAANSYTSSLSSLTTNIGTSHAQTIVPEPIYGAPVVPQPVPLSNYGVPDLLHSSSIKTEAKVNSVIENEETHGKDYGKSVAASFGPNSELVESQSLDLNNIPLQGNLGSYTLQIQSADGGTGQVSHSQVLNEGLLQSILQAIEQPGKQGQNTKYPIVLQPSIERNNYSVNDTIDTIEESEPQGSEIREVIVNAPESNSLQEKTENPENEETLQLLDTSNIALYYKKDDDVNKTKEEEKTNENNVDEESN